MPETTRDRCITPSFSPSTYHHGKLMDGEAFSLSFRAFQRSGTGFALGKVPLGRRQRRLDGSCERDQWRNVVESLLSTARSVAFGGLMLVGVGVSTSANAAIISGTYDVTGTGFTAVGPS